MFLSTELDYLVIWNFIVQKNKKHLEYIFNKQKILSNFFNENIIIFEKIGKLLFKWLDIIYNINSGLWKIKYIFSNDNVLKINFIENNVIWYRKNILLIFKWKFEEKIKNTIINNSKLNKSNIYKLLSLYYKDLINDRQTDIIVRENNFIL
jgi:hypothetical protein